MTTPLTGGKSWPQEPTGPSVAPYGYVTPVTPDPSTNEPPMTAEEVAARRNSFYELLFQQIMKGVFGFFTPASGTGFAQFSTWATSLLSTIGGTVAQAIDFITNFLDPAKLLFSQTRVENPPQAGFPLAFPITFGELDANPIELLVQNLSRILTGSQTGGNLVSTLFTVPTAASNFIQSILMPQNQIAALDPVTGLVPDTQKPQSVQDIIDHSVNAFRTGLIGDTIDNPVEAIFDVMFGIFGAGSNAQSVNVIQNSQLDALSSGGSGVSETFDGAQATNLGSHFDQLYYGAGSGTEGVDGAGNAVWVTDGFSVAGCINRHVTALTSDTQKASIILNSNIAATSTSPMVRLQLRMNSAKTECVEARITRDNVGSTCEIGYMLGGTYTRFGAVVQFTGDDNGVWELKVGTVASAREFTLYRNGVQMCNRTDSGALSVMGASNRFASWAHQAGVNFFFVFYQVAPPAVASFSASDRTASS